MLRWFVRDESGMTMGLTVIMIALIGVMGAGLLTFVMTDLRAVVEVNKGQKALDIADAGVQAAKSHLRVDSFREHYDTDRANDCLPPSGIRVGIENWSKATQSWAPDPDPSKSNPGECHTMVDNPTDNPATPWPEQFGVTKTFAGGRFHVTIECFVQGTETVASSPCKGGAGYAPVASTAASDQKFFKITSTGYDTAAGNGAIRKIEAIYTTAKRTYAPIAYWTPRDIEFAGTKCVKNMSFFAGRNITAVTHGSGCGPDNLYGTGKYIAHRPPTTVLPNPPDDAIYGHWQNTYNPTMRKDASGNPILKVGFGAVGRVCGGSCPNPTSGTDIGGTVADGRNDYDRTTGAPTTRVTESLPGAGQRKKFVGTLTDPANQITFPFDEGNALANPSSLVDAALLEEMRAAAAEQNTYVSTTGTHKIGTAANPWPGQGATYFVDGADDVEFVANDATKPKGVIIVRNGNFSFSSSSTGFQGVIIVIGNGNLTAAGACDANSGANRKGYYTQSGSGQLDGYVAASGCVRITGDVSPSTTIDYTNLNSFYDVKLWSWRELYQ